MEILDDVHTMYILKVPMTSTARQHLAAITYAFVALLLIYKTI